MATGLLTETSRWLDLLFSELPLERLVLPSSRFSLLALGGALLVSSSQPLCQSWESAGGQTILFQTVDETSQRLASFCFASAKGQGASALDLSDLYSRTLYFASRAHAHQRLPGSSLPYVTHLVQVAQEIMLTAHQEPLPLTLALPVALLHDVLEDTPVTVAELEAFAGSTVTEAVQALTKNPDLPAQHRMRECLDRLRRAGPLPAAVKLADRLVNLQAPPTTWSAEKIAHYRDEGQQILQELGWASPHLAFRLQARLEQYPPVTFSGGVL
ncbi:MAG: bifunctional (p)ppGpp synthetase/guanosine-3',5'-bis(diphosphate) 3'-pyrophosphohydrolase [Spirochaetales bacterium]|nr:bifunctional (p)ppGpp synthetase/guanosine-3',5'-bis(diphosphate) 3'-pyrophosphohydrolase [Spirochaetales bacterium]